MTSPALLILGPTASGKTDCALHLAQHLPIEIISVDSALIYRDMNIGTAKPSDAERGSCPHHLIDILTPEERYSAASFRADAIRLMDEITGRGHIPVLVGGTMLYFKALRDGLSDLPNADAALRAEIDHEAERCGWPALHAELARIDPEAAAQLNPNDAQRIQRALEIVRLTGRSVAENQANVSTPSLNHRLITFALNASNRSVLHTRIETRFDRMLDSGLLEELRSLRLQYRLSASLPSMRCVGYRQAWDHLEGQDDLATMRYKGIVATRQLAKRQITWQRQFVAQWSDLTEVDCLANDMTERVRALALTALAQS